MIFYIHMVLVNESQYQQDDHWNGDKSKAHHAPRTVCSFESHTEWSFGWNSCAVVWEGCDLHPESPTEHGSKGSSHKCNGGVPGLCPVDTEEHNRTHENDEDGDDLVLRPDKLGSTFLDNHTNLHHPRMLGVEGLLHFLVVGLSTQVDLFKFHVVVDGPA